VAGVEQVRFTNCGTEAVMAAVKATRAYTGRHKIAKFEGCFHGAYDYMEVSLDPSPETGGDRRAPKPVRYSPGASPGILDDVVVMPFNDLDATKAIIERERENLACVIVDPMPNRIGMIPAKPGFLLGLREITRRHRIMLLSDEVITFRLAYHGAQSLFGYEPDLTTFGKVIGGGYPVGAIGGPAKVMAVFDGTHGKAKVPHAGTFNANPVTMTAGVATLEQVTPATFNYLDKLGEAVRSRLNALFRSTGFEAQASGAGSIFRILLTSAPLSDYRSALVSPERKAIGHDLYMGLLARGVALTNTLVGCISTPMTMQEVDTLVAAVEEWIQSPRA
jgi:glutamate-1-semialdehyde 2,1-aminomutase